MAERELIEYVRALAAREGFPWLRVGIGDDAAVLDVPGGGQVLVTTDSVVEGVHFAEGTEPALVGRKAVARSVSDIAAMAGRPLCSVAAVNIGRRYGDTACRELCRALWEAGREFAAPLVGGDVSSAPDATSVTVTVLGTPGPLGAVTRGGARAGNVLCVTGRLGGSIRGRHLSFRPRVAEALALAERFEIRAMIDVSDGLSTDALHLAEASGAGMALRAQDIPISDDAATLAHETGRTPLWHALDDGEDYELLFCLGEAQAREAVRTGAAGTSVSAIGEVIAGTESYLVMPDGRRERLIAGGWEHLVR
jgi:thiamine-monophosphate kinase